MSQRITTQPFQAQTSLFQAQSAYGGPSRNYAGSYPPAQAQPRTQNNLNNLTLNPLQSPYGSNPQLSTLQANGRSLPQSPWQTYSGGITLTRQGLFNEYREQQTIYSQPGMVAALESLKENSRTPGRTAFKPGASPTPQETEKHKINPLGFIFPVMAFIGAPLVFLTKMLGVDVKLDSKDKLTPYNKDTISPWIKRLGLKRLLDIAPEKLTKSNFIGRRMLNWGVVPKNIVGMLYGISSGQPSILVCHLFQNVLLKENALQTTILSLMGALFSLGFANNMANTQRKEKGLPVREYDMTRLKHIFSTNHDIPWRFRPLAFLKKVFSTSPDVSWLQRPFALLKELGKMTKFFLDDNVIAFGRAKDLVKRMVHHDPNKSHHDLQWYRTNFSKMRKGQPNELEASIHKNSAAQTSLFVFLNYAANIPALALAAGKYLLNLNDPAKAPPKNRLLNKMAHNPTMLKMMNSPFMEKWYCPAVFILASFVADTSFILYALTGKKAMDKIPAAGQTMEMIGTVRGYSKKTPVSFALQKMGGALNSIYFAYKASDEPKKNPNQPMTPPMNQ